TASRYTTAAVSRTFLGRPSAEAMRSSSDSANARFRSVALLTRMRRCHLRRRYNWARFLEEIARPYESRLRQSIMVERPLSWIVKVIGAPTRDLFMRWS